MVLIQILVYALDSGSFVFLVYDLVGNVIINVETFRTVISIEETSLEFKRSLFIIKSEFCHHFQRTPFNHVDMLHTRFPIENGPKFIR